MTNSPKEIDEAKAAARRAKASLEEAYNLMTSAGHWGIWDILGGGGIVSFIKHSKIDKAQMALSKAQRDIRVLERELKDLVLPGYLDCRIDTLWTFMDLFCDSGLADIIVQSKINRIKSEITDSIEAINAILNELNKY